MLLPIQLIVRRHQRAHPAGPIICVAMANVILKVDVQQISLFLVMVLAIATVHVMAHVLVIVRVSYK